MLSLNNRKPSIYICIIIIGLSLITILFISSSSNNYSLHQVKFQLHYIQNLNHSLLPRLLCLISTSPKHFLTRTKAVHETWAPHCNRYFFITEYPTYNMTTEEDELIEQIPILPVENITAGYDHLTQKSVKAFLYAYENYYNDFDWFVKADDDTFMIIEHLKMFLNKQNKSEPITFGYNFKVIVPLGFHSGGASYVLSRESLRRFYEAHQESNTTCRKDGGSEDVEIAICLRSKGVYPGRSLDDQNRELFHPIPFADQFLDKTPGWLHVYAENPIRASYDCCSDQTVSFHYINPDQQYLMDFILYKTQSVSNKRGINR